MAEWTETTTRTYTVNCPECHSDQVRKHGKQMGEQRYFCKPCKKAFRAGDKAEGRKMNADMMGSAVRDYYDGKSYKKIAEGLKEEYDLEKEPSKATIYEWVRDYTSKALKQMKDHPAKTGGHWVADEMAVKIDAYEKPVWLWNVMDSETRYILASHITPRRDAQAARVVLRKALAAADKPPKTITTDKLKSYIKPIRELMPEAKHMQSQGMGADINNNMSERLQGTFRDRIKTLRSMNKRKTAQHYLDGWVLNYNHFKGHHSLHNKRPAQRAKVDAPFNEWADVVKAEAASPMPKVKAGTRPDSQPKPRLPQRTAGPPKEPTLEKSATKASVAGNGRVKKAEPRAAVPHLRRAKKRIGPRPDMPRKRGPKLHPMAKLRRNLKKAYTRSGQRRGR